MASWFKALAKTREKLSGIFSGNRPIDEETVEELEEALLAADIPARMVMEIAADLESRSRKEKKTLRESLRGVLLDELGESVPFRWPDGGGLFSVMIVGINGSGKTTTAAKLAHLAQRSGHKALLGAGDTFRAAGSSQLRLWAERVGCDAVGGELGQDSAAVAFDAVSAAKARGAEVLIFDTAGRMHTKEPLMRELEKIRRSMGKALPDAPHETWIVLDASLGQNAVIQARYFNEIVPLTGVIVSKLDGSSKGGFLFAVKKELNVPVLFAGLGEGEEDLVPFDPESFVDSLLG